MGYCSCGNWVDEGSVCSHCGGGGGSSDYYDYEEHLEDIRNFERDLEVNGIYDDEDPIAYTDEGLRIIKRCTNKNKAESCREKGDHANAIKFYKIALDATDRIEDKCYILSAMAREYEEIADYASAEDCWNRCCETSKRTLYGSTYMYVAYKGDFFHRRGLFEEAIAAYEESLNELNGGDYSGVNLFTLKCYARTIHFIIDSNGKLGRDNRQEEYHAQLRDGVRRCTRLRGDDERKADDISITAWEIYEDGRMYDEALILIDSAIELHPHEDHYLRKAIFIKNKLEIMVIVRDITPHELELINEAIKILPDGQDNGPYLKIKGDILNMLGDPVNAKVCYALAAKDYGEVEAAERQLERLKAGETYINITGIHFYRGFEPFKEGIIVDLIREPDNPHDRNAIRVEIDGETVGYVANSRYTVIKEVSSATDIKNIQSAHAEVQFILFGEWVIAKLI